MFANNGEPCVCEPAVVDGYKYVKIIAIWFGDCVHTPREITSFVFGLVSLICFAVAFFPQIYLNYTRKSVEGLSWRLMVFWVFGDIGNLIGSIYTNQLALQVFVAVYFILLDVITLCQIVWYGQLRERLGFGTHPVYDEVVETESGSHAIYSSPLLEPAGEQTPLLSSSQCMTTRGDSIRQTLFHRLAKGAVYALVIACVWMLLIWSGFFSTWFPKNNLAVLSESSLSPKLCNYREPITASGYLVGCILSWISGLLYFFSRTSQITENYERKSVEGLSIALFILCLTANSLYGLQIIVRGIKLDSDFYLAVFPFLIGSIGTLIFDSILIYQAYIYGGFK